MSLNIFALNKTELKKRTEFKCTHGHTGIAHPRCFDKTHGLEEKIGILDIESSNLNGNWGFIFSYCIKTVGKNELIKRVLTPREIQKGIYDKDLLKQFCQDIRKYNRIVGYYSSRFDLKFLRTRCVFYGLDFPLFKEISTTDLYDVIKHKFKFHSNRLEVVSNFFNIPAKKHKMLPSIWFKAMAGNKKALQWILLHNIEDVISTEQLWEKVYGYHQIKKTSI